MSPRVQGHGMVFWGCAHTHPPPREMQGLKHVSALEKNPSTLHKSIAHFQMKKELKNSIETTKVIPQDFLTHQLLAPLVHLHGFYSHVFLFSLASSMLLESLIE